MWAIEVCGVPIELFKLSHRSTLDELESLQHTMVQKLFPVFSGMVCVGQARPLEQSVFTQPTSS